MNNAQRESHEAAANLCFWSTVSICLSVCVLALVPVVLVWPV